MSLHIGEPLYLETKAGPVHVRYVRDQGKEGVCLVGQRPVPDEKPVPLRVQSSCLFSESFGSTDCDCALQLKRSLAIIIEEGGIVIYFYEEGRGAGLEAKIEAMRLEQTFGIDTLQAYKRLNLKPDIRNYKAAADILTHLLPTGRAVALLTNNPRKEKLIRDAGVNIVQRRPLVCNFDNPYIHHHLQEKVRVLGHEIDPDK
jgi:GTP cyclohydrolase II